MQSMGIRASASRAMRNIGTTVDPRRASACRIIQIVNQLAIKRLARAGMPPPHAQPRMLLQFVLAGLRFAVFALGCPTKRVGQRTAA